jgi:deazaflavin-dependent oxidoreductase (nitroreductase family)
MTEAADFHPPRRYRPGRLSHAENVVMTALTRIGVVPHSYVLTTRGRRTGRERHNRVLIIDHDQRRWLVAPYGAVSWVHNARAAGQVRLTRRGTSIDYRIREVSGPEAGPVLKKYVAVASATRQYFRADRDDPVDRFVAEARHHPVFELVAAD